MINFPIDPEIGQNYTDPSTDITWVWTGETWDFECELPPSSSYIGVSPIDVTTFTDEIGNKIITVSHEESGVVPGTYNSFTVDEFGHIIDTSTETVGHIIQNSGSDMPQRRYLDFRRMIVTDNQLFNQTVVTRPPSVSVGVDPPTEDLLEGDEWIDSLNWKKYIRYDDYWVETGKVEPSSSSGSFEGLNDTFTFEGNAGKFAVVNDAETALIPVNLPSGGFTDVGAGLSIDGDGNPQLGTSIVDPLVLGTYTQISLIDLTGRSLIFGDPEENERAVIKINDSFAEDGNGNSVTLATESSNAMASLSVTSKDTTNSTIIASTSTSEGVQTFHLRNTTQNKYIRLTDTVNNKGIEYNGDYEANFTARSLVTKQWVENDFYPEAVERENNTVIFDKDYVIGNAGARTGNILFDFTGARLMSVTRMIHNDGTEPTFPAESVIIGGEYELSVNNYIYFICTKKSTTQKVEVTISQEV
jgi:hypothetical protein